jgi:N6-adenosine-specific RNA methylase IME4
VSADLAIVPAADAELDLPEPQDITVAQVRTVVIPRAQLMRERIRECGDIGAARELTRRLEAFRRYVTDKTARDLVAAETRRTEVLIGELLGPVTQGQRTELTPVGVSDVPRQDRIRFRLLAENKTLVEEMLSDGKVSRKALLESIQYRPGAPQPALSPGQCTTLVADPPWRYGNTATRANAEGHYDGTLSIAQLCGTEPLPDGTNLVSDVVHPKAATPGHLYLWSTAGHLPEAFKVMQAWGFTYKTYLVWVKPQMGMGNYFRVSTELVLFGVRGGMRTRDMGLMNYFTVPRGKHSSKPSAFYDLVAKASPGPYLEMFARCDTANQLPGTCQCSRCARGWEVWGNQA